MMRTRSRSSAIAACAVALVVSGVPSTADAQALTRWTASEQWRLDGTESGEPFADLRYAVVLPNGHLWLLDAKDQQLRRFDASGRALGTVGRNGQGPGEFEHANGMVVRATGEVWVNNPGNARFDIFDFEGKLKGQLSVPFRSRGWTWEGWFDAASGELRDPISSQRPTGSVNVWRRVSPKGEVLGEVDQPGCTNAAGTPTPPIRAETKGQGNMFASYPFASGGGRAANRRDGMWCAMPSSRRVALVRLGGADTIATTSIDVPPVRVSSAERDSAIARTRAMVSRYATHDFDPGKVPSQKPGIARIHVDIDNRLWVQHASPMGATSTTFDIHDARGAHLARLTIPYVVEVARPMVARANDLWISAKDEDDVISFVKLRVK